MFEFHGWAVLAWPGESGGSADQVSAIAKAVDAAGDEFSTARLLTPGNDLSVVSVHGLRNHRAESVLHLFQAIAREAPASYGLLYVRDDEDARGDPFDNSFCVWRLALGLFSEAVDPFLSPCVPIIEPPYDSANRD